jgi:hypothetical protein
MEGYASYINIGFAGIDSRYNTQQEVLGYEGEHNHALTWKAGLSITANEFLNTDQLGITESYRILGDQAESFRHQVHVVNQIGQTTVAAVTLVTGAAAAVQAARATELAEATQAFRAASSVQSLATNELYAARAAQAADSFGVSSRIRQVSSRAVNETTSVFGSLAQQEGRFVGLGSKGAQLTADTQIVCFVAGTKVVTDRKGHHLEEKQIQEVKPGDYVLSRDQNNEDGKLERRKVMQTFVHATTQLQVVRIKDLSGKIETIRTTPEHPFWVQSVGWLRAASLSTGMRVDEADGSDDATIISSTAEAHPEGVKVYNFEVEGDHTYFVSHGRADAAVWVHNTCAIRPGEITSYGDFANRSQAFGVGDQLAGHELLQNAWLRSQGLISGRLSGLSRANPVMALDTGLHANVTAYQSLFGLHDRMVLTRQTRVGNIRSNLELLRRIGINEGKLQEFRREVLGFARTLR